MNMHQVSCFHLFSCRACLATWDLGEVRLLLVTAELQHQIVQVQGFSPTSRFPERRITIASCEGTLIKGLRPRQGEGQTCYCLTVKMRRLLGAVTVLVLLAAGVAGRDILQSAGSTNPTSFEAKKNANSQGTASSDTAVQQALQNQQTTQLQSKQTQMKPQGTQKKTLQQVGCTFTMNL